MMRDLPIRNIFLPATLTGVSIFSTLALMLPSVVSQYAREGFQRNLRAESAAVQLRGVHKEVVITYIGSAIVVSAVSGLGVAELLRRRSAKPEQPTDLKSALAEFVDSHAQQLSEDIEVNFSALLSQLPLEAADLQWPQSDAPTTESESGYTFPKDMPEAIWEQATQEAVEKPVEPQTTDDTVMIFPAQYQRCRIQAAGAPEQQYAIEFDGQFYSLLSSGVAKEQAIAAVNQLAQEGRTAILTKMNQGYAVWMMEPEAQMISVA